MKYVHLQLPETRRSAVLQKGKKMSRQKTETHVTREHTPNNEIILVLFIFKRPHSFRKPHLTFQNMSHLELKAE